MNWIKPMNSHEKLKQKAIEVALTSEGQFRLGSVLVKGRRIISTGTNISKSHPVQQHYAKKSGQPRRIHLHSELRALIRAKKDGNTMYVARVSKNGYSLRMSRPCQVCRMAMAERGVTKCFYTTSAGWEEMRIGDDS